MDYREGRPALQHARRTRRRQIRPGPPSGLELSRDAGAVCSSRMRVACCQLNIAWEDRAANWERARTLLGAAQLAPGSLFVLPEMFPTGFSMNVGVAAENSPYPTEDFLRRAALEHKIFVVGGFAALDHNGVARNQAVVTSPEGRILARYNKIHPFTLGGEAQHYAAGTEIVSFDWNGCRTTLFICYDLRFPEVFRAAAVEGTQLFVVIANWPAKRDGHWVTLLQARAIENQAYVVGVNRCGTDPHFVYSGRSVIVDPHGAILVEIVNEEGVRAADLDLEALQQWRQGFPALPDMHWRPWAPHLRASIP